MPASVSGAAHAHTRQGWPGYAGSVSRPIPPGCGAGGAVSSSLRAEHAQPSWPPHGHPYAGGAASFSRGPGVTQARQGYVRDTREQVLRSHTQHSVIFQAEHCAHTLAEKASFAGRTLLRYHLPRLPRPPLLHLGEAPRGRRALKRAEVATPLTPSLVHLHREPSRYSRGLGPSRRPPPVGR